MGRLADTLRDQGDHEAAIEQYERLLADPPADAPREFVSAHRQGHRKAVWEIAYIYLDRGDFAAALEAFRAAERAFSTDSHGQPYISHRIYQGLCLEHLGRHQEAAAEYWRTTAESSTDAFALWLRLVRIYDAAGERDTLRRHAQQLRHDYVRHLFTTAIEMQAEAERGDWASLIDRLATRSSSFSRDFDHAREWQPREAARLLATRPEDPLPLLLRAEPDITVDERKWLWYAMALVGTPEARAALEDAARAHHQHTSPGSWLVYTLMQFGDAGREAVADIYGRYAPAILESWDRDLARRARYRNDPPFPPIPQTLTLDDPDEPFDGNDLTPVD